MGLLECASGASVWRGYDYYNEKRVKNLVETAASVFTADVMGTASEPYVVEIDVAHPRKSTCNCPHADGKRIVCKHMVAAYFTAFPEHLDLFARKYMDGPIIEDLEDEELIEKVKLRCAMMTEPELHQALLEYLCFGPNWQMEKFLRDHYRFED